MGRRPILKRNYDNKGNLISKECYTCHKIKSVSEFSKCKSKSDGYKSKCKECDKEYCKRHYENNKENIKEKRKKHYKNNKEKKKEYSKQYYENNKENIKEYRIQHNKLYYEHKTQEALENIKSVVKANPGEYNLKEGEKVYGTIYLVHNIESNKYYVGKQL